jgi:hypothetical protein
MLAESLPFAEKVINGRIGGHRTEDTCNKPGYAKGSTDERPFDGAGCEQRNGSNEQPRLREFDGCRDS